MKAIVLLNAGSGPRAGADDPECEQRTQAIGDALAAAGIAHEIVLCEPARLTETARERAHAADVIVAAGGDGTVSAVAAGLVDTATPLAVLPLGTLNHFAKDLGMPVELAAAARAIAGGLVQRVDVGEVNGRVFLNNSSIGLYPEMVRLRERDREERGRGKWTAAVLASWRVLRRFRRLPVRVEMPHRTLHAVTPFVFVGNNDYSTDVGTLGRRPALDGGRLALYMVRTRSALHMLLVLARAIVGRAEAVRELEAEQVTELWVSPRQHRVRVARDGEVEVMGTPLHYRIRPRALAVIVAPVAAEAEVPPPAIAEPPAARAVP